MLKYVSTSVVESAFTYHNHSSINRTRAHVLIYVYISSLLTVSYKTKRKHNEKPYN